MAEIKREILNPETVRLAAGECSFTYRRLKPATLLLTIEGDDVGQFGTATMDEVNAEFERFGPVMLYLDTRRAVGPSTTVMEAWTAYFAANRRKFRGVHILVLPESKLLHLTVSIVQHLSGMAGVLQIYGEPAKFQAALQKDVPSFVF
ncbi:MAG TPA: hypothetical protein VEK08_25585 [Planctomycetota bacterium]|nr:hypothetical protein [Planctomycetota bacterium]